MLNVLRQYSRDFSFIMVKSCTDFNLLSSNMFLIILRTYTHRSADYIIDLCNMSDNIDMTMIFFQMGKLLSAVSFTNRLMVCV